MSYFVTHQTASSSPFDEALERQRQPLLHATMADDDESKTISCGKGSLYSKVAQMYRKNDANTSPSSEIPAWSTKYREHDKTSRGNVDDETTMTKTIDFEYENLDLQLFVMYNGTHAISTSGKEPYLHQLQQQQQLRQTQIKMVVGIATVAISIVFLAGTFITLVVRIIFA